MTAAPFCHAIGVALCVPADLPGKYRCGCGVLISNVGEAEREHCKSDRHQKWLKSQQTTKTLSAFSVKEQNPVGSSSSSSSSSITNTSNNCSSGNNNNSANSSSNIGSRPFSPGRAPQPPPQMFIRVGGVWVGGLVLGGWVGASKSQNPPAPCKRSLVHTLSMQSANSVRAALKSIQPMHTFVCLCADHLVVVGEGQTLKKSLCTTNRSPISGLFSKFRIFLEEKFSDVGGWMCRLRPPPPLLPPWGH